MLLIKYSCSAQTQLRDAQTGWLPRALYCVYHLDTSFVPFVPVSILAGALGCHDVNIVVMATLAALLGSTTEELVASVSKAPAGPLNATFHNIVELIAPAAKLMLSERQ